VTGQRHDIPQRRLRDNGRCGVVRAWVRDAWWSWGQPVFGLVAISVAIALVPIALQVKEITQDNARATRQNCERARVLGPALAADYEQRDVLSGERLRLYRSLIPKTCPKSR
jgi:hypothetical protein